MLIIAINLWTRLWSHLENCYFNKSRLCLQRYLEEVQGKSSGGSRGIVKPLPGQKYIVFMVLFKPAHKKTYNKTYKCNQQRLQHAHLCNLIRALAHHMCTLLPPGYQENPCHIYWGMYRLIWVFAGHTGLIVGFVVRWLICKNLIPVCIFFFSTNIPNWTPLLKFWIQPWSYNRTRWH